MVNLQEYMVVCLLFSGHIVGRYGVYMLSMFYVEIPTFWLRCISDPAHDGWTVEDFNR